MKEVKFWGGMVDMIVDGVIYIPPKSSPKILFSFPPKTLGTNHTLYLDPR